MVTPQILKTLQDELVISTRLYHPYLKYQESVFPVVRDTILLLS